MAADYGKPTTGSAYTTFPTEIRDNFNAAVTVHETDASAAKPTGAKRISATGEVQRWSGAAWLTIGYTSLTPGRNKILNGDMVVAQRGTSFTALANGAYCLDRWMMGRAGAVVPDVTQESNGPFAYTGNCLKLNVATADNSISASDYLQVQQMIEGYRFRTLYQQSFTISFWVKASLAGTYCVSFRNSGLDRSYVAEYVIAAGDIGLWVRRTITVTALPSGGTWNFTTGQGLRLSFCLSAGALYQTTAGAWQTGNYFATSNQVNMSATSGNNWSVTGVQVEIGAQATPFEELPYEESLLLCQRYALKQTAVTSTGAYTSFGDGFSPDTSSMSTTYKFPVTMRIAPALTTTGTASDYAIYNGSYTACSSVPSIATHKNIDFAYVAAAVAGTPLTAGHGGSLVANNNNTAFLLFDAEL